jgi:phage gp36-like protein
VTHAARCNTAARTHPQLLGGFSSTGLPSTPRVTPEQSAGAARGAFYCARCSVPHPYAAEADMHQLLGEELFDALCTMGGSQSVSDVYAQAREGADSFIDTYLANTYAVPFDLTASPLSAGTIAELSNWLTAMRLFAKRHPQGEDWRTYRELAYEQLDLLREGKTELPDAGKVDGDAGSVGVAYLTDCGAEPLFAGTDADGNDRTSGW